MKNVAELLADRFTERLLKYVGDKNMTEIAKRNHEEKDKKICHSHDFCDANQAMIDAWKEILPEIKMDHGSDQHADLINRAWAMAKKFW